MSREYVIRLAREVGMFDDVPPGRFICHPNQLERFANIIEHEVRDALAEQEMNHIWQAIKVEREACVQAVWGVSFVGGEEKLRIMEALRARGTK